MSTENELVGVVGAGLMGAEIALVHALAGFNVRLCDRSDDLLTSAIARLANLMEKGVSRGLYTVEQKTQALARIAPTIRLADFGECQFIVEAVYEEESIKSAVLRQLDEYCAPQCIFASNTSTIPISTLASALSKARQVRFIGTHFFSPVSRMKLVEVVRGFRTSDETFQATMQHCQRLQKTPIRVKDVAGFAVNRMLHAFIIEAVRLVEEQVATPEDIDIACRLGLGHPMGPFELMDAVSSALCVQAQEIMQDAYGERFRPPSLLKQRVAAGYAGGKGKPGWYSTD